jgi:hypothetical protein
MSIDRTGKWWTGSDALDLDEYLVELSADGYRVGKVVHSRCADCGSVAFKLRVDDEEGCENASAPRAVHEWPC